MTAEYIVDFVKRTGFNFEHMLNDPYWFINDELSEDDKEIFDSFGKFQVFDEEVESDDKRLSKSIVVNFKSLGIYIKESRYYVWQNFVEVKYSQVEPVGSKIVFGQEREII